MIRLLFVEDDPAFRSNMARWLGLSGFDVTTADDGLQAAELLQANAFDLVLTDLWMPHGSGLELLDTIARAHPGLPVVFLTGQASVETAIAALREGRAFDFVLKPLTDLPAFAATLLRAAASGRAAVIDDTPLAARDREILALVGQGLEDRAIARQLALSDRTVRNRLSLLYARLGVENRMQAMLWARERGLL